MGAAQNRSLALGRCVQGRPETPTSSDLLLGSPYIGSPGSVDSLPSSLLCAGSVTRPCAGKQDLDGLPTLVTTKDTVEDTFHSTSGQGPVCFEEIDCDLSVSSRLDSSKGKTLSFKLYDASGEISHEDVSSVVESLCGVIGSSLTQPSKPTKPVCGAIKMKLDLVLDSTEEGVTRETTATCAEPTSTSNPATSVDDSSRSQEQAKVQEQSRESSSRPIVAIELMTTETVSGSSDKATQVDLLRVDESEKAEDLMKRSDTDSVVRMKRARRRRDRLCATCARIKKDDPLVQVHHHHEHTHKHHHFTSTELSKDDLIKAERRAEKAAAATKSCGKESTVDLASELAVPRKRPHRRKAKDGCHRHPRTLEDMNRDMLELYLTHRLTGKCPDASQQQPTSKSSKNSGESSARQVHHHHHHTHHHHHHHTKPDRPKTAE